MGTESSLCGVHGGPQRAVKKRGQAHGVANPDGRQWPCAGDSGKVGAQQAGRIEARICMNVIHGFIGLLHVQRLIIMMMVIGVLTMYREMRHFGRACGHRQWGQRRQALPKNGYQQKDRS
jgi:hypothetical protein